MTMQAAQTADAVVAYDAAGVGVTVATPLGDFFDSADTSGCPLAACALYEVGCTTPLAAPNVALGPGSTYKIRVNKNVQDGWTTSLCLECRNSL